MESAIKKWLQDGVYKPGEKIPPKGVLVEQFPVSWVTIRQPPGNLQPRGSANRGHQYRSRVSQKRYTFLPLSNVSGGFMEMPKDEAIAILEMARAEAVKIILALAQKSGKCDACTQSLSPRTPSGMTLPYLKPNPKVRKNEPGRKKAQKGASRFHSDKIDHFKEETLVYCSDCYTSLKEPVEAYRRYRKVIPPIDKPEVTEHTVHRHRCAICQKLVNLVVPDVLPSANIGLRIVDFTVWLHCLHGIHVKPIVRILPATSRFFIRYDRRKERLYRRLWAIFQIDAKDKTVKRLIKRLRRHQDELFIFLDYANVSPYNYLAEQQTRQPVSARKVSQQNRSEHRAKTQAVLMRLFRSADHPKRNPVETILPMSKSILATPSDQVADDDRALAA